MRAAPLALVLTVATAMWACGGGTPLSPSAVSPLTTAASGARIRVFDELPAEGAPHLAITITGSIGTYAFNPNPLQAMLGDMLVWTNDDVRMHHIVLEDGTDVGQILPGASSAPVPLAAEATSYYCLVHPSMFGVINRELPIAEDPYPDYSVRPRRR